MSEYPFKREHEMVHQSFRARGVEFVDALSAFGDRRPQDLAAHPFDRHYNREGHGVLARTLLPRLETLLAAAGDDRGMGTAP